MSEKESGANKPIQISITESVDDYGSKGQSWHTSFIAYMKKIVTHPNYLGMPDAIKEDGKIQWEAPSNRQSGKFKDTHHKRRDWWRKKSQEIGIDQSSPVWISETAKAIHPFGRKPCKRCGKELRIVYAYPNGQFYRRLIKIFGDFQIIGLEEISPLLKRLAETYKDTAYKAFPKLLSTSEIKIPDLGTNINKWEAWVEKEYIPQEPALMSPGSMSNAPDRFDGFHSFNLCCRKKADTGRHDANMKTYVTDRRVFEYWTEGDWISADRLMGQAGSMFQNEPNADGGDKPNSLDHIGPLSLGFCHRTEFRLLSKAANSAKNNRMTLWDVKHLTEVETRGVKVISWYASSLWNKRKSDVVNEETALRISKILRDNQRIVMYYFGKFYAAGHLGFMCSLLDLEYADFNIEFENLRLANYLTVFDAQIKTQRKTKYAQEQKARRIRIGFEALGEYKTKENWHFFNISSQEIEKLYSEIIKDFEKPPDEVKEFDKKLLAILSFEGVIQEEQLRELVNNVPEKTIRFFVNARGKLQKIFDLIGIDLANKWEDERYVRSEFDFDAE